MDVGWVRWRREIVALGVVLDPGEMLAHMRCPVPGVGVHVGRKQFAIRQRQILRRDKGRGVEEVQIGLHDVREATLCTNSNKEGYF